jgi:radical SAM/SPASM domain FxsB family protein
VSAVRSESLATAPQPLTTFILKVAGRCNIDCDYCYMYNHADQSWKRRPKLLAVDVVELIARRIARHASAHALSEVRVILHGGEPLLYGPERTSRLCAAIRGEVGEDTSVRFAMQTNGTLLSRRWLPVLREHEITVSFSLDGPAVDNDLHRRDRRGGSTHAAALRGVALLRDELPEALDGVLCVVDLRANPERVYGHLAELGFRGMDFLLPHATHDQPPPRPPEWSHPAYGRWLARVFDAWAAGDRYRHSIRIFEHIIGLTIGHEHSVEYLGLAPVDLVVVESDGAIEAVDTLKVAYDGAADLGLHVGEHDFDAALSHPAVAARQSGLEELSGTCRDCADVSVCGGGYLPHRFAAKTGFRNPSVYCEDLRFIIHHVQGRTGLRKRLPSHAHAQVGA